MLKNKFKILLIIFCLFLLSGSAFPVTGTSTKKPVLLAIRNSISRVTDQNKRNLVNIYTGMVKEEVLKVMGNRSVIAHQLGERIEVKNPYRIETLVGKEDVKEKKFEILFYVTEMFGRDYRITDAKLTPLVFEDNKLIGMGWRFYKDTIQKYGVTK